MKIVNAEWEKRNLGVETIEISIDRNDSLSEVEAAVKNPNAQYIVLKIPNDRVDIIFAVQKYGYIFIEGMVHLVNHLKNMEVSKIERRIYDSIDIVKMDSSDIDYLKKEVSKLQIKYSALEAKQAQMYSKFEENLVNADVASASIQELYKKTSKISQDVTDLSVIV